MPEADSARRVTRDAALERNAFVADMADVLLVAYANPGGSTDDLCRNALRNGKRVLTIDEPGNEQLIALGAEAAAEGAAVLKALGQAGRAGPKSEFPGTRTLSPWVSQRCAG